MKIIYGSSTQKNIDRSQRINRREKKKRHSRHFTPALDSVAKPLAATGLSEPEPEESPGDSLKGIPHEISLIIPEHIPSETENEKSFPEGNRKQTPEILRGGERDENNEPCQSEVSPSPELVLPPEQTPGLDERSRRIVRAPASPPSSASDDAVLAERTVSDDSSAQEAACSPNEVTELARMLQSGGVTFFKLPLPPGCGHKPIMIYLRSQEEDQ